MKRSADAIPIIGTGMEVEEKSFIWEINNFPVIFKDDALISSQRIEFTAGDKIGQPSTWRCFLQVKNENGKNWIGAFFKVRNASSSAVTEKNYFWSFHFTMKPKATPQTTIFQSASTITIINRSEMEMETGKGLGLRKTIEIPDDRKTTVETLEIHVDLKLYSPAERPCGLTLQQSLERFQLTSTAKARANFAGLIRTPVVGIEIVSSDGKEFIVVKGILTTRSPVFESMLRTKMTEANARRIELTDMTGKTLEVFLHFIYTGELLSDWKEGDVIVELTNAAAKYELSDLLSFLDGVLGKVCQLGNVLPLLTLANRLSMKTAEQELLKFIREKGATTTKRMEKIFGGWNDSSQPK